MKKTIRLTALILGIIMLICFFTSCALYNDETKSDGSKTSETESERDFAKVRAAYTQAQLDTPVITIGERNVTWSEYLDFFEEIYSYYKTNYGMDIMSDAPTLTEYLDLITESLAKDTMVLYKADELGLSDLTDEQKAEIQANYEKEVSEMYGYYIDYLGSEEYEDDAAMSEAIDKYIIDEAEYYCGEGTTIEEYLEYLYKQEEEKYIKDLLYEAVTKDVTVPENELREWYDKQIDNDTEYFKEHPESYKDEVDSYEITGYISDEKTAVSPLYIPEGYARVYHILFKSENKTSDKYEENKDKMEALADEYGKLSFEIALNGGTETDNDRLNEIMTEYSNLAKENKTELSEAYKDAKEKADEAYAKLEAGEDFAAVMKEYTDDTTFAEGGAFAEKGRLISTRYTSKTDWSESIKREFGKLKKGEYSSAFIDDDGYHIIFRIGKVQQGKRTFEDAKAEIEETLMSSYKDNSYSEQMETWLSGGTPLEYNHELIESLVKRIGE